MKSREVLTIGCLGRAMATTILLAACANPANHWHKAGVADAQRDRDYGDCRELAHDTAQAGIDQDLAASRAATSHGPAAPSEMPPTVDTSAARAASEALIACMTDKGYHGE